MERKKMENAAVPAYRPARLKKRGQWQEVWQRFKRNRVAMVSLILLCVIIIVSALSGIIAPYEYWHQDLDTTFALPSLSHVFGTDNLGRDIFSRVLVGGRVSLLVAFTSIIIAAVTGSFFGAIAGYFGGKCELIIMKCTDILMAIPAFLMAVTVSAALGTGIFKTALAVGISSIPQFVRLMRAETLRVKDNEYIEAARASGATNLWIIAKHVLPNALSSTIVNVTLGLSLAILHISGLSFVGLGIQPPTPEWGSMLAGSRSYIRDFWPMVVYPGAAIVVTLILFNLVGDGLRDAMDPKLKN
jgi:peptide/nickel transport system permease protein